MTATVSQIPFDAYRRLPGTNSSALSELRTSALSYQYYHRDVCGECGHDCMGEPVLVGYDRMCPHCSTVLADNSRPDTPAKLLGRAAHSIIIEPDTVKSEYAVYRESKTKGEGARLRWQAFQAEHEAEGKTILDVPIYDTCWAMRRACYRNRDALSLLAQATHREISIIWTHRSGELMKSRIDMLTAGPIVDMKSTRDITKWRFERDAKRLGYHCQAALYQDAVQALTGELRPYKIMAPQSVPPYDAAVFTLPDEALRRGRETYEAGIAMLQKCRAARDWPGMYDCEQELEIRGDYDDDDLICEGDEA